MIKVHLQTHVIGFFISILIFAGSFLYFYFVPFNLILIFLCLCQCFLHEFLCLKLYFSDFTIRVSHLFYVFLYYVIVFFGITLHDITDTINSQLNIITKSFHFITKTIHTSLEFCGEFIKCCFYCCYVGCWLLFDYL